MKAYSAKHVYGFQAVAGVELIVAGLFLMFASHRYSKITLYTSLYILWHSLLLFLCYKIRPVAQTDNTTRQTLYLVISQLLGIALAVGSNKATEKRSWKQQETAWTTLGNAVLGCLSGISFGLYLLATSSVGMFKSTAARALVVLFATLFHCILAIRDSRTMRKVCSAIVGAYLFVLGTDCFAHTGYFGHLVVFLGVNRWVSYDAGDKAMVLHAMAPVLALAAGLWQTYDTRAVVERSMANWSR
ncbi:hypothetical protein FB645_001512 [Coemansia sp. IMI 203386]|nr:hypothetical protein FB645_001512 [Coemansia sp. IMI 203386]